MTLEEMNFFNQLTIERHEAEKRAIEAAKAEAAANARLRGR
jgi:hypothetical protein